MNTPPPIPVVGLLGGVGAGKSSVARRAAEHRSILVLDGDVVGHELLHDPTIRTSIRSRFGDHVFDANGAVDRRALGRVVFAEDAADELAALEAILHPRIREELRARIDRARRAGEVEAIVLDAALLLDAGWQDACNALVFVDTPYENRRRHVESRGWDEAELRRREAAQLPLDEKRAAADHVIPNNDTLDAAAERFLAILDELRPETDSPTEPDNSDTPSRP